MEVDAAPPALALTPPLSGKRPRGRPRKVVASGSEPVTPTTTSKKPRARAAAAPAVVKDEHVPTAPTSPLATPLSPEPGSATIVLPLCGDASPVRAEAVAAAPAPAPAPAPSAAPLPAAPVLLPFAEPRMNLATHAETIKELAAFHVFWETCTPAVTELPAQHLPLVAKLAQDSIHTRGDVAGRIAELLFPPLVDDDGVPNPYLHVLPRDAIARAIDAVATRVQYGATGKGKAFSVWRWEVNKLEHLPLNARALIEQRRQRRQLYKDYVEGRAPASALLNPPAPTAPVPDAVAPAPPAPPSEPAAVAMDAAPAPAVAAVGDKRKLDLTAPTAAAAPERELKDKKPRIAAPELPSNQSRLSKFFVVAAGPKRDAVAGAGAGGVADVAQPVLEFFKPFFLKPNVELAPLHRAPCHPRHQLDALLGIDSETWQTVDGIERDYLHRVRRARPALPAAQVSPAVQRLKYLKFGENVRPAYFGTWSKRSAVVRPRRPLALDRDLLQYDVDSDDEWEEEEVDAGVSGPVISLTDSEDEEEDEDYNGNSNDEDDEDDDGIVPDGYLSADEGDPIIAATLSAEARKGERPHKDKASKRTKLEQVVPTVIQPHFQEIGADGFVTSHAELCAYAAVSLTVPLGIPVRGWNSPQRNAGPGVGAPGNGGGAEAGVDAAAADKAERASWARTVPADALPVLAKLVHRSVKLEAPVSQFQQLYPAVSRRQIDFKVKDMFVKEKRPDAIRELWYLRKEYLHLLAAAPTAAEPAEADDAANSAPAVPPSQPSILRVLQRAAEKRDNDERMQRSMDGDDEGDVVEIVTDASERTAAVERLCAHLECHGASEPDLCCAAELEAVERAGRSSCTASLTPDAVQCLTDLAIDPYALARLRTSALAVVERYLRLLMESGEVDLVTKRDLADAVFGRARLLPLLARAMLHKFSPDDMVLSALRLLSRLVRFARAVFDHSRAQRFAADAVQHTYTAVFRLLRALNGDTARAALTCMFHLLPAAELSAPSDFWTVTLTIGRLLRSPEATEDETLKLRMQCVRGLRQLVRPDMSLAPPRINAADCRPLTELVQLLAATLRDLACEAEPSKSVQQCRTMVRDLVSRVMHHIMQWRRFSKCAMPEHLVAALEAAGQQAALVHRTALARTAQ